MRMLRQRGYLSESKGISTVLKNTLILNGIILPGLMSQTSPLKWVGHEKKSIRDSVSKMSRGKHTKLMYALDKIRQKYGKKDRGLVKQLDVLGDIFAGLKD